MTLDELPWERSRFVDNVHYRLCYFVGGRNSGAPRAFIEYHIDRPDSYRVMHETNKGIVNRFKLDALTAQCLVNHILNHGSLLCEPTPSNCESTTPTASATTS
jgi:hypothetical protein